MAPKLTIIILSYNVRQLLANCLESLFADPNSQHWQIIIVDNASTDDTVDFIKKNYETKDTDHFERPESAREIPAGLGNSRGKQATARIGINPKHPSHKLQLISSPSNLGFSAGNNLAVPYIKADYTLFINSDTEVPTGTIPFVLDYLKNHSDVGAATCKILLPNGKLDDGCHRGFPTPWNSFCHFSGLNRLFPHSKWFSGYWQGYKDFDTSHQIDALTGAFMMLPTQVGEQLHWWDEDYFFNGEDLDFCYRIRNTPISSATAGAREIPHGSRYQIMYLPQVTITHFKGSSGGYKSTSHGAQSVSKKIKLQTARASTQAMKLFYQKHYSNKYPKLLTILILLGINLVEKYRLHGVK